ncbi:MAG: T9SS type A sorting domain-containing protein [Phaeodactylibacter sp.]|nr:T9SS type A sorting domain-containing protein [Phaeodactylibacter sp.]
MRHLFLFSFLLSLQPVFGQYAPPAGQPGSTAVPADSPYFTAWGTMADLEVGPIDITDPDLGLATAGTLENAYGIADGITVSLGDGGRITYTFGTPVADGPGWDFAVFENAFSDAFLELAFVEVSSDGLQFVRFPASSLTPTDSQVGTFGLLEATKLNNLAGKYRGGYGTPFDLWELKDSSGIDISNISHIRIIDVVGSIDLNWGQPDHNGQLVNDPFPTSFESGGFDVDAVGILEGLPSSSHNLGNLKSSLQVWPNPGRAEALINIAVSQEAFVEIYSISGQLIHSLSIEHTLNPVTFSIKTPGVYFANIRYFGSPITERLLILIQ